MKLVLEVVTAAGPQEVLLSEGRHSVGREVGDVVIGDPQVSSRHGEFEVSIQGIIYRDLGSTNGSFLGEERLARDVTLEQGTELRLGGARVTVVKIEAPVTAPGGTQVMQAQPALPVVTSDSAEIAPTVPPVSGTGPKGARVRHNYPLSITDDGLMTAVGLMMKTMPYTLARFGILVAVSLISIIWLSITVLGMGFFGSKAPALGWIWAIVGFASYGWVWHTIVRYGLHLLKAGHIAVLTELITKGTVGSGDEGMFQYGKKVVKDQFGQVNVMFGLDLLIKGIVRAFNRTLSWITSLIPVPGLQGVTSLVNRVIYSATTYVDETIFSYNLARGDENVWRSSREGLIYYAQNSKEVLKTGIYIVILDYVFSAVSWVVMLAPAFVISLMLPKSMVGAGSFGMLFVAVLFAANVRSAFLRPLFLTMVMVKFHSCVQGQEINEEWDEKLTSASGKFRELSDKARNFVSGDGTKGKPAGVHAA